MIADANLAKQLYNKKKEDKAVRKQIMTLHEMSAMEEGQYFERKSARKDPKEIVSHILGFANAGGGILVVGIEDNGKVTGFHYEKAKAVDRYLSAIRDHSKNTPVISVEKIDFVRDDGSDDFVLSYYVEPSSHMVLHASDDTVYLRMNDSTVKLTHEEITRLQYEKKQLRFEDLIEPFAKMDDLDTDLLEQYRQLLHTDLPYEKILEAKGFLRNGELSKACILLFAKSPGKFMPSARMRFLRYEGKEELIGSQMNIIKDVTFEDALPRLLEKAKSFIAAQLRDFQFLGSEAKFVTLPEYPEFAWIESIVNALVHRDYSYAGDHVRIKMFDDRLSIFSPSPLPKGITLENMSTKRNSRNERIASVLILFGWVRELNEGINRMIHEMREFGLPDPEISEPNKASVLVVLRNNIEQRKLNAGHTNTTAEQALSSEESKIIKYIRINGQITSKEAASLLNRAKKSASILLRAMADKNLIQWNGKSNRDPYQYYSEFK